MLVHTTELNISSDEETIETGSSILFRKRGPTLPTRSSEGSWSQGEPELHVGESRARLVCRRCALPFKSASPSTTWWLCCYFIRDHYNKGRTRMNESISPGADLVRRWPIVGAPLSVLIRLLRIGRLQTRLMAAEETLRYARAEAQALKDTAESLRSELNSLQQRIEMARNDWREDLSSFRGETGHRLACFTAEFKSVLARDSRALERAIAVAAAGQARNDVPVSRLSHPDFYVQFEDAFRGRWKVEERMRWYAAYLRPNSWTQAGSQFWTWVVEEGNG